MRKPQGGWEEGLSPETINNFRQNSPELVIRDARRMLGDYVKFAIRKDG